MSYRELVKKRDKNQCQICGENTPVPYGRLEVHHIVPRYKGGNDESENLITLCDLCHAVLHPHMGPSWVGLSKFLPEEQKIKRYELESAQKEFERFLHYPIKERRCIQSEMWFQWGVRVNR